MRMVLVIVLTVMFSLWFMSRVDAQALTHCQMSTDVGLLENSLPLKIDSCRILATLLDDMIKQGTDKKTVMKYGKQWIKNCTKTDESDLLRLEKR